VDHRARAAVLALTVLLTIPWVAGCQRSKPPRAKVAAAVATMPATPSPTHAPLPTSTVTAEALPTTTATLTVVPPETVTPLPSATAILALTATLTPTTVTPTPFPTGDITYTVREGDTLLSLAEAQHTTVQAIMGKNGLTDPNRILVGQTLIIPVGSGAEIPPTTVRHVVKPGETLSQLARTYRTTVADIAAANPGLSDLQHLKVGSTLTITMGTAPSLRTHRVQPGESLASIARRYGVSIEALAQANGLSNPNRIPVGQVLIIPQ